MSPAFQSPHPESEWSRRDAISNLTNVRLKIFKHQCVFQRIIRIRWARVFESTHSETGRSRGYTISNLVHIGYWLRVRKHKCRQKATGSQVVKKPRIPGDPPLESRFVANNHRNVLFHLVEKYGKWRKRRIEQKLFCTYANAKRLWLKIRWRLGLWKMRNKPAQRGKRQGQTLNMCERQDENAMKNKFQFNWTAT